MKKVLFIDRDGTLIEEPPDRQVDSFAKLKLLPGVITNLGRIAKELEYELVMVSNQDGLGTPSLPHDDFYPVHEFLIELLAREGIEFSDICIDCSFEHEARPTRKPGTGMLTKYLGSEYDLANSFVVGDRPTDVELARNLGARAIFLRNANFSLDHDRGAKIANDWEGIYKLLRSSNRIATHRRTSNETDIQVELNLDGTGVHDVSTGLPFLDHMLEQFAKHSLVDLMIHARGDLEIDDHHTIEDVAITLGGAVNMALGEKRGIERYGFSLPMDDCFATVAIDLGGRSWLVWKADFARETVGRVSTEMFPHFFRSFSDAARCNIHVRADGSNEHHKIESIFKAFARAFKAAVRRDQTFAGTPSTKGFL